jgi:fatty acid-binding protein DegV
MSVHLRRQADGWCALQVAELAKDNKKFNAIDRAIGKDSFKVGTHML